MDWTGATNTPTLAGTGTLAIYGDMTLIGAMTLTATGTLKFKSDSPGRTINTAGKNLQNNFVRFDGNGSWGLAGAINMKTVDYYKGTFTTNNFLVTLTGLNSSIANNRTLNLGASIVTCNGDWSISDTNNFTLNAGTSTLLITGTTFRGGYEVYNNVTLSNTGTMSVYGSNTFNTFNIPTAATSNFQSGTTQTAAFFGLPSGNCASYKNLKSSLAGTQATLSRTSGITSVSFTQIKDIAAAGGGTFNANNSLDDGNNSGWNFVAPPPADYYWVGNTGNWSDGAHWATASGGAGSGCIPTKQDNVFFDANSFTGGPARTVTVDVDANCNTMDWTGINTAGPRILAGAVARQLQIHGSLILNAGMTNSYNGTIFFKSDIAGRTINLTGKILNSTTYFDGSGNWTLAATFAGAGVTHSKGTLNTNNFAVNISNYSSSTSYSRQLALGSSTVTVTGTWQLSNGTGFIMNAGTSNINIGGTFNYFGGLTYNNIVIDNASTISVYGGGTFNALNFFSTKDIRFEGGKTVTFTTISIPNGTNCSNLVKLRTINPGVPAVFSMAAGTYNGDFLQITDLQTTGGATFNATNSYGIGDVTGWNITSPAGTDFYWVGGTGNWSDPTHWSLTSGGASGTCIPSILDNIFFDVNSFSGGGQTMTVDVAASCNKMTWTGAAFNPTFAGFQSLNINGSITLIPAMNLSFFGTMAFTSSAMGNTIDFAGHQVNFQLLFNGSGGWDLTGNLTTSGGLNITFNNGNLNTNNYDISMGFGSFTSSSMATRTLTLGNSVITTTNWNIQNSTGITLNAGTSQINISGFGFQFAGGSLNYNVVNLSSFGAGIYGSNSFDTLNIAPGMNINFEDSATQTINVLNASGTFGANTNFISLTAGAQAILNITGGPFCGDYMNIKDNKGLGGPLYAGDNSVNNGNNSGWNFSACPVALTAIIADSSDVTCNGANDGTATAVAVGGFSPYTYLWSNSATTAMLTGLAPGTYTITVTDNLSATATASVTISQPASALSLSSTKTNVSCNGGSNGSIDLTASGGTIPYLYLWSSAATTEDISSLTAGTYSIIVTDANSCTATTSVTIPQPASALSVSSTKTDVSCNGGNDGAIDLTRSGGTSPYSYLWSNSSTTEDLSGLMAGTYSVTATDANSCTATTSVTITQPASALSVSSIKTDVSCNGGNDGAIDLSASGGTSPYSYLWGNSSTTEDLSGLSAATFSVTVTDTNSCTATASATIAEPTAISISFTTIGATCGNSDGDATANATGGTGGYSYLWSDGQTTQTATGLAAGNYSVTVTDANSCTQTGTTSLSNIGAATLITITTEVACNGGNDGAIDLTASGGTPPYSYLWSNGATTEDVSGLTDGIYNVTVADANSCVAATSVNITEPAILNLSATQTNVSCNGLSDGSATVTASGGTPSYTYLWSNGVTTSQVTNLTSQIYSVTITDANGCAATASVSITQPTALSINVNITDASSCIASDGSATANVSGGIVPYTYSWSNGGTTDAITGLAPGTYTLIVTDTSGCAQTTTATVNCPISVFELLSQNGFIISPNPSNGTFIIETKEKEYNMVITNILGEKIYNSPTLPEGKGVNNFDLSSQPNGIYFLQIKTEQGIVGKKIIISK